MSNGLALAKQMRGVDKAQGRAAGFVPGNDWYQLRVAASCPPDKQLHLRGGLVYCGYYGGAYSDYNNRAYTVPDLTADLADSTSVSVDITFTNANWYKFAMLLLKLPTVIEEPTESDWLFYLFETGEEFETPAEAEAWMESETFRHGDPWSGERGYPLVGVVLRNDGQTGVSGAFLPVDVVNRDRSYIWPSDVRPRKYVH